MTRKIVLTYLAFIILKTLNSQSSSYDVNFNTIYGTDNCGFGYDALNITGSGSGNTAMGYRALKNNNVGENNTADGLETLYLNSGGNANTAFGMQSLYNNGCLTCVSGNQNTGAGAYSLFQNKDGNNNTACGINALKENVNGNNNTAVGSNALTNNNLSGASGGNDNTAYGSDAMKGNTQGSENTAVGIGALNGNSVGNKNTALGFYTMFSSFGNVNENTAIGLRTLGNNGGNRNIAMGTDAIYNNLAGFENIGFGKEALFQNYNGVKNIGFGRQVLYANKYGVSNIGLGSKALFSLVNNIDSKNISIGASAGVNLVKAYENTAIGNGAYNTNNVTLNQGNTALGAFSDLVNAKCATAIGYGSISNADYKIRLGNTSITTVETQLNYSWISDGRFKYDISEKDIKGIEFIKLLRPVNYNFDTRKYAEFISVDLNEESKKRILSQDFIPSTSTKRSGFIAQEIEQAAKKCGYSFNGVIVPENIMGNYSLSYDLMVVPLVKTIQEQQAILLKQKMLNEDLLNEIKKRQEIINNYSKMDWNENSDKGNDNFEMKINIDIQKTPNLIQFTWKSEKTEKEFVLTLYDESGQKISSRKVINNTKTEFEIEKYKASNKIFYYTLICDEDVLLVDQINSSEIK